MGKDAGEKSPQSYLYGTSRTFCSEDAAHGLCSRPQQNNTPIEIGSKGGQGNQNRMEVANGGCAMSKLGILVNTDKYLEDVVGVAKAAKAAGHDVTIFMMDDGTLLAQDLRDRVAGEAQLSYCEHSASARNVEDVEGATSGSQYQNAVMMHEADKVVVF